MKTIFSGFLLGLMLAFSFGPGFWALVQVSLFKGFKNGLYFLLGFLISDLSLIVMAIISITSIKFSFGHSLFWGILAALVLMSFGIVTILKRNVVVHENKMLESGNSNSLTRNILRGFLFNMSNPYNFIFWIGVVGMSSGLYGISTNGFYLFIFTIVFTTVSFDVIKCYFASKLKNILNVKYLSIINFVLGIVMMGSGVFIFVKTVFYS